LSLPERGGPGPVPAAVVARDVAVAYPRREAPAVSGISFELGPGSCLLVVGPSGSGKSTLARAIGGLVPWAVPGRITGDLTIDGLAAGGGDHAALVSRVGHVFQDPASQLVMERVEDDVAFGLEGRAWRREAMLARVPEALAEVGLAGFERRRTARLSGGEQQRLAMAGAIAPRPGILVLDEPTANLDPPGADAFAARLAALRAARAATIVLVEHRADLAWPLADLVLALGPDGRPLALGPPGDLLATDRDRLARAGIWLPDDPIRALPAHRYPSSDAPIAEVRRATFAFDPGLPVLEDLDLVVGPGERVVLLGPNGSGKSTLARLLVGLLRPSEGRVLLAGREPSRAPARDLARLAGYVPQDPERGFTGATVEGDLLVGLAPEERARAGDVADSLGLPLGRFGARNPYTLSGGEQRRLSLASQLVRRPKLLVLDEPTFGQDRRGYTALLDQLRARVDAGTAVVAATHDLRFAGQFADRVVALEGGRAAPVVP
jgi:energy-coupling factor transport system ATP-binding protein